MQKNQIFVFGLLFLGLSGLLGLMAWPHISSIIFAGILAGAFYPVMEFFTNRMDLGRTAAAALVCVLIVLVVFLPVVYIIVRLSQEVYALYIQIESPETVALLNNTFFGEGYIPDLGKQIFEFAFADKKYSAETVQALLLEGATSFGTYILKMVNALLSNMFAFFMQFLIMLLLIFAIFREGPELKRFLLELSPLPDEDEELLIRKFNEMNFVTLIGNGIGGIIQGVPAGIAFAFLGIGSPTLWTVLMIILAFIPLLGISVVTVPATLYLLAMGKYLSGAFLFIFTMALALLTENWFKPIFLGKQVRINSLLLLFSILGAMSAFGMAGIFYGPLIITIFLTVVTLYEEKYAVYVESDNSGPGHSRPRSGILFDERRSEKFTSQATSSRLPRRRPGLRQ